MFLDNFFKFFSVTIVAIFVVHFLVVIIVFF